MVSCFSKKTQIIVELELEDDQYGEGPVIGNRDQIGKKSPDSFRSESSMREIQSGHVMRIEPIQEPELNLNYLSLKSSNQSETNNNHKAKTKAHHHHHSHNSSKKKKIESDEDIEIRDDIIEEEPSLASPAFKRSNTLRFEGGSHHDTSMDSKTMKKAKHQQEAEEIKTKLATMLKRNLNK